jgi:cytochrome P450
MAEYPESRRPTEDDLLSPTAVEDPYPVLGALRELDPVHWSDEHRVWFVTRYDDVVWVTRHPELFSSSVPQLDTNPPYPPIDPGDQPDYNFVRDEVKGRFITLDPPEHRRKRSVLQKYFSVANIEGWRGVVHDVVDELLEGCGTEIDVLGQLAVPIPLRVIAEMMAIPTEGRAYVRSLAENLLIGPRVGERRMRDIASAMRAMASYLDPLVDARMRSPGEDIISLLAGAEREGVMTRAQVLQNATFLAVAGHETSINLICNGLVAFARHPREWQRFRSDPDRFAVPAVEECLRYDPPVKSIERIAVSDVTLRGKTIPRLDRVRWFIASANRDPARFDDPDVFDIARDPNPHVAFGHGIHLCLGAAVARMEGQEVMKAIAKRAPSLQVLTEPITYNPAIDMRSMKSLTMRLG